MDTDSLFDDVDPLARVRAAFLKPGRKRTWHEDVLDVCGFQPFAGTDEAGRGPLAGPVVAGAVIMPQDRAVWRRLQRAGVGDSKALSEAGRDRLFPLIHALCRVGVGSATPREIDRINILQASLLAMRRAVEALGDPAPRFLLIDGRNEIPLAVPQHVMIKGDARSLAVGAASIVAKVTRDRLMLDLHQQHPAYGWARNKGYPSPEHLSALASQGPCEHHRFSFAPLRKKERQSEMF